MKKLVAVLGFTLLASPVFATTVLTTGLMFSPTGSTATCGFVNAGSKPVDVVITLLTLNGAVVLTGTYTAEPKGQGAYIFTGGIGNYVYCTFQPSASSKTTRGSLVVAGPAGAPQAALPAN
jgi:hypothetical protein